MKKKYLAQIAAAVLLVLPCLGSRTPEWFPGAVHPALAEEAPEESLSGFFKDSSPEEPLSGSMAEASPTVAPPERIVTLKKGSKGDQVRTLQLRLTELGYLDAEADGIFGASTKEAVKTFQKRNGLSVDGIAGPKTQTCLYSADAVAVPPPPVPVDVLAGSWPMLTNLQHPVSEDFLPADLVLLTDLCDPGLVKIKYSSTQGVRRAVEALIEMLEAARADGITKWQVSAGYRSWADQEKMLNNKINSYMKRDGWTRGRARRAALKTVAEPGASEHHLGLSFDVNVPGASSFAGTRQCKWLHAHCWDYGFIVRYQEDKQAVTGFAPEAWHIRYTGVEHSRIMRDENLCLEEYLEKYMPDSETDMSEDPDGYLTEPEDPEESDAQG